jgi:hypothetical protein
VKTRGAAYYAESLANSSPVLRSGNPGEYAFISRRRNSEGVASPFIARRAVATSSELRGFSGGFKNPGLQCQHFHPRRVARPGTSAWAGISERFQRSYAHSPPQNGCCPPRPRPFHSPAGRIRTSADEDANDNGRIRQQHREPRSWATDVFGQVEHAWRKVDQQCDETQEEKPAAEFKHA